MNQIVNPIQQDQDLQMRRMMLAKALGESQTRAAPQPSGPLGITPVDYNAFSDNFFKFYKPGSQQPQPTQPTDTFTRPVQNRAEAEDIYGQSNRTQLEHIFGSPPVQTTQNPGMLSPVSLTNATNYFPNINSARGG